jgi:hypothetical protein
MTGVREGDMGCLRTQCWSREVVEMQQSRAPDKSQERYHRRVWCVCSNFVALSHLKCGCTVLKSLDLRTKHRQYQKHGLSRMEGSVRVTTRHCRSKKCSALYLCPSRWVTISVLSSRRDCNGQAEILAGKQWNLSWNKVDWKYLADEDESRRQGNKNGNA